MSDRLIRAITADGCYRVVACRTTDVVAEALRRHRPSPVVGEALARGLTAAAMLSVGQKDFHRIGVQWMARGPVRSLHVDVRPAGRLRGYPGEPQAEAESVEALLGGGVISVIEQDPDGRFTQGSLPLHTGGVDEDLERWLRKSEQVPSRLRVLIERDEAGLPAAVAGVLVQTLPGGAAGALLDGGAIADELLQRRLSPGLEPEELARAALTGSELRFLDEEPLLFRCACSLERVERGVAMLGAEEITGMIEALEPAEVRCEFCAQEYRVDVDGLARILDLVLHGGYG
jgi:molecular chaperone Hsp33